MVAAVQRAEVFAALQTSEERLTRTAAAAGCGLWEVDPSSGEVWVTPLTRRLDGIAQDDTVLYARFLELLHPEDRERVGITHAVALDSDVAVEMEHRIVLPDGAVRWLHAFGQRRESGRLLGAAVDVTARVLADERAREQAMRVAAAVDTAEVAFADSAPVSAPYEGLDLAPPLDPSTDTLARWTGLVNAVQDITERRGREEALKAAHDEVNRLRDKLERENVYLRREVAPAGGGDVVTGRSPAIAHAMTLAEQVAATDSTVLLVGETGTGKERFAAYVHEASQRRGRHMVRVNCSAIPSALIESELFGREKGAYTGALSRQIGRFELANGSTLFLDEIGDLPLEVQVKLLRVLQERTLERLGSPAPIGVDVRIIAATNRDLEAAVRQGAFRSDLYYRLNVFPIVVPPLRDRLEDIPTLVETLVDELGDRHAQALRPRSTAPAWRRSSATRGPATCGNCAMCSSGARFSMLAWPHAVVTTPPSRPSATVRRQAHGACTTRRTVPSRDWHQPVLAHSLTPQILEHDARGPAAARAGLARCSSTGKITATHGRDIN